MTNEKYRCVECKEEIFEPLLKAPNPFDPSDTIEGCPHCRAVNSAVLLCDEPGCLNEYTSGYFDGAKYRLVCSKHFSIGIGLISALLCDEPGCLNEHTSGYFDGAKYRLVCSKHFSIGIGLISAQ